MVQRRTANVHGDWSAPCFDSVLVGWCRIPLYFVMRISDSSDVGSYIGCEVVFNRRSDRLGRRDCADAIRYQRASDLWGIKVLTCQTLLSDSLSSL